MADAQKRTLEQVSAEYQKGCLQAGHIQYQQHALGVDLGLLNEQLRELNLEAAKLQAEAKVAAAEAAPVAPVAPAALSVVPAAEGVVS